MEGNSQVDMWNVTKTRAYLVLQYIFVVIMMLVLLTLRFFNTLPNSASPLAIKWYILVFSSEKKQKINILVTAVSILASII